jgi:hypothetical protein
VLCRAVQVVHEPVEEWQRVPSIGGSTLNLLDKFYQDPKEYAYVFQNYVFMSRVMQVRRRRGSLVGTASCGQAFCSKGACTCLHLEVMDCSSCL